MPDLNGITIEQGKFREIKHNINEIKEYDTISTNGVTRQISFKTVDGAIIFEESIEFDIVYLTQAEQDLILAIDNSNSVTFTPYDIGGYYVYTCTCSVNPFYFYEKGQKVLSIHVNLEVISKTMIPYPGVIFLQDIYNLRNSLTSDLTLDQDLDFNDDNSYDQTDPDWQAKKTAWTTGTGWPPISGSYEGNFDGAGFTISNLFVNDFVNGGLFESLDFSGTIENLTLSNVDITCTNDTASDDLKIGALVGINTGTISNCHIISGTVTAGYIGSRQNFVGMLIGQQAAGLTNRCSSSGTVTNNNNVGYGDNGGLVGVQNVSSGIISNSYSNAAVTGYSYFSGGLIGQSAGTVTNSYSYGIVSDGFTIKGFIGLGLSPTVTSCYFDHDITNIPDDYAVAKTTTQMKKESTFTSWDFTTIWDIVEDTTYPFFL